MRGSFSCSASCAQILKLRGMIEVERQNPNTLQAEVVRFGSENLHQKKRSLRCKLAAMSFGRIHLSPPSIREMKEISQELEWMQMEENMLGSAATGSVGMCADDTTLIAKGGCRVRLVQRGPLACPSKQFTSHSCLGDTPTATHKFLMFLW